MRLFFYKTIPVLFLIVPFFAFSQTYLMNQPMISDCDGYFMDTGGSGGAYGPNENFTTTICPDFSTGTHVQLIFSGVDLSDGDNLCFYDGLDTNAPLLVCSADFLGGQAFIVQATAPNPTGCLTLTFESNDTDEGSGWSADINCVPACQTIMAELVSSDPPVMPADTGYIDACPNQRIYFTGAGSYPQDGIVYPHSDATSTFLWNFGDGHEAVGPVVSHVYDEPGGYVVELTITDHFGCSNNNFLSQRVRIATYPDFSIAGDLVDQICVYDTLELYAIVDTIISEAPVSVQSTEGSFQSAGVRSDSLPLPDGVGAVYETSINFTDFSPGQVLTDINELTGICVNMEHSWMHDLDIFLSCPDGTQITLQMQEFIGNEVFLGEPYEDDDGNTPFPPGQGVGYDYCWTPGSTNTWTEYTQANDPGTLPSGDYESSETLNNLLGCPLNGEWSIIVSDQWGSDNGWVFEWSIGFAPELYPFLETFNPGIVDYDWVVNPTIYHHSSDSIAAAPQNAGIASYTFEVTDSFNCVHDTMLTFTVLPPTHPDCHNCGEIYTMLEDTIICEGESVQLDASAIVDLEELVTFENFENYEFSFQNHPPMNPYGSVLNVNSIGPATLVDPETQIASVCVNIQSYFNEDIDIYLEAPNGQTLELSTDNGGFSDHYTNTCFVPGATTPIFSGNGPFTGDFMPEGPWNDLQGAPINGDWKLVVIDDIGLVDLDTLISWSISFNSLNDITYSWTFNSDLNCLDCPDPEVTPAQSDSYYLDIMDLYGCSTTDTVTITVSANYPAPNVSCENTAPGEITYNWLPIAGVIEYEVNVIINNTPSGWQGPVSGTTYVVNGLATNDIVTLEVRAYTGGVMLNCFPETGSSTCEDNFCDYSTTTLSIDSVRVAPVLCYGESTGGATAFASGGVGQYAWQWSDANTQISSAAVFLPEGSYTVSLTDEDGCLFTVDVQVTQPDPLDVQFSTTDVLCKNGIDGTATALPSGGVLPYSFAWEDGQQSATAEDLVADNYALTVTDDNGCIYESDVDVSEPLEVVSVGLSQSQFGCFGTGDNEASALPAGGTGSAYTYSWEDEQDTQTAVGLQPGNFAVTVTDEAGCEAINTITLTDLEDIYANIIATDPSCFGLPDGQLGVNDYGGGNGQESNESDYTFEWSSGHQGISVNALTGDQTYWVTITDQQGCFQVFERFLPQPAQITFETEQTGALCFNSSDGTASVTNIEGGVGDYFFQWDANAANQNTDTATGLSTGNYNVTVSDFDGCFNTAQVYIEEPPVIKASFTTKNNECFGDAVGVIQSSVEGGTAPYTYTWEDGSDALQRSELPAGIYTLVITDQNGCVENNSIEITQPDQIKADIVTKDVACFGNHDGKITVNTIGGIPPYQYSLDNNEFTGSSILIALEAGDYTIFIKDSKGCMYVENASIIQPAEFVVNAGADTTIFLGETVELNATSINANGQVEYVWSAPYDSTLTCTECLSTISTTENMITYELYGIDANGCEATDLITVFVSKPRVLLVPTGFSPNGDNVNDLLMVHGQDGTMVKVFQIFNRWGELLYEALDFEVNDHNIGWDGTFRGKDINPDVFIWKAVVEYADGAEDIFSGQTTLLR